MPQSKAQALAIFLFVAGYIAAFFSDALPSFFTIATFSDQPEKVKVLRWSEVYATVLSLGIGVAASFIFKTIVPVIAAVIIIAILLAAYEWHIKHPIAQPMNMRMGY